MTAPTISGSSGAEPAEGSRDDDASPKPATGGGEGVSATKPAEGGDDAPGERPGSLAAERASEPGPRRVTLAAVTGAHGIGGEVRLKLFTGDLAHYASLDAGGRALTLLALRGAVARFAEVGDRTAAEALRGVALTVPRDALPPLADGEYYHADLIGLHCVSTAGDALGEVAAVENFGAGDVLEIARTDGSRFMVPMRQDAVPEWDADRLVVDAAFVG